MKVLKTKKKWNKKFTCSHCETRVQVEASDFERIVYDDRDGNAVVFTCPTCKREQWISIDLIPASQHHLLPK